MRESSHDAERLSFGSADSEVTMPGQPIELILMRELGRPSRDADLRRRPAGDLIFYNEPAERLLGTRFDETG